MNGKTLIAYFSASGETARLAQTIADVTGGDLHEIIPKERYTSADLNWNDSKSRSSVEMNDPASRPAIANRVKGMEDYDIVFIGFPIWWYVAPTIISTFLEAYDFSGKTVIPFATSGGSDLGGTETILKTRCSADTKWLRGKRLSSSASASKVRAWIAELGL